MSLSLSIPASTSNLGPAFDTLGLALRMYLRVTVHVDRESGPITCTFADQLPVGDNQILKVIRTLAEEEQRTLPGLHLDVRSEIPQQSGLGSSAAATIAGLRVFETVTCARSMGWMLTQATRFEGHPDNASPALLGGLTAACRCEDGRVLAVSSRWPEEVGVIVAIPAMYIETNVSRQALPQMISREDAIFNLQRTALLLQAVHRGEWRVLREALRDRWHQPFRAPLVPAFDELLALEHPALLGAFLSGSGPSVVVLTEGHAPEIELLIREVYASKGLGCRVAPVRVHQPGI